MHGAPLDHVTIHVSSISKDTPVRIRPFPAANASIGHAKKAEHREQAERMKQEVPGLLLTSLVNKLKAAGFADVAVLEKDEQAIKLLKKYVELEPDDYITKEILRRLTSNKK